MTEDLKKISFFTYKKEYFQQFSNFSNFPKLQFQIFPQTFTEQFSETFPIYSTVTFLLKTFQVSFSSSIHALKIFNEKHFPQKSISHLIYHLGENVENDFPKIISSLNHYYFLLINFYFSSICVRLSVSFSGKIHGENSWGNFHRQKRTQTYFSTIKSEETSQ